MQTFRTTQYQTRDERSLTTAYEVHTKIHTALVIYILIPTETVLYLYHTAITSIQFIWS